MALLLTAAVTAAGCASTPSRPSDRPARDPDAAVKAATLLLTDGCLRRQGLTTPSPHRPRASAADARRVDAALFGAGATELSLKLPTGYTVRAHTDGCLASAQQKLYGDQRAWFRASVVVNNLKPEAKRTRSTLADVRARHRAEIAAWQRMRARAHHRATALLDHPPAPPPTG
ncbi:hypothetical protein FCH28_07100 [Streptomyces piniterrae]|uniref:Lipoprotein n=1 Tax=Streptomyces piniterrae TaxID=2571125 RepID=A0A4U0NU17_9ACTN|nr:hypothetical protein FCH28_07100 [Streptomyces piniterrae]